MAVLVLIFFDLFHCLSMFTMCLYFVTRYTNWASLVSRCASVGLAPLDVVGDGNCLIWSLRCFRLGWHCDQAAPVGTPVATEQKKLLRKMLAEAWLTMKGEQHWQRLFVKLVQDDDLHTPQKKTKMGMRSLILLLPTRWTVRLKEGIVS